MSTNFIESELIRLREQHASTLDSKSHSDRAAALAAASAAVQKAREHDRVLRQQEDERAAARAAAVIEVFKQAAETQRRSCADALCAQVFAPGALPDIVAAWRREPTRAASAALQKLWHELDAVAQVELGEGLGVHLLLAAFADQIANEIPGSAACLSMVDHGSGVSSRVIEALGLWRKVADVGTANEALQTIERELLTVARGHAGAAIEAHHSELQDLRRVCATRTDWVREQNGPGQRASSARAMAADYIAPSREGSDAQPDQLRLGAQYARQMAGSTVLERIRQAFGSE